MNNTKLKQLILKVLKSDERLWNSPCGVENTQRGKDKTELNQTLLLDLVENIDEKVINLLLQEKDLREKFFAKINKKFPSDRGVASRSDDGVFVFKTNDFRFFMEENKVDNSYTQYKNRIGLTDSKRFLKDTNDVVLDFPYKDCVLEGGQSTEEGKDNYFDWQDTTYKDKLDEHGKKIKTGRRNVKVVDEEGHYEQITTKRKEIFFNSVLAHNEIDRLFDHKALTNWKRFTKDGEIPLFEGCPQGGVETKDTRPEWQKRSLFQFWNLPKNKKLNQRAKELRKQGILSEVLFWKSFKEKEKIKGYDIDRQVIIGNFIVDFFIAELGLVIEIDGSSHDDKQEYDKERQAFLEGLNLQVVRYSDIKVKKNINGVYEDLLKNIEVREKELSTSPAKAGTLQEENKSTPSNSTNLPPLKRGIDGTIKENLIIKGNNLLALHSLKKQFAGKVKLIYIDPPYNTGNDGFKYNDNFNHSTWLTFMKNRLEVAKDLLRDDGVIFVSINDNESAYLKVLMDEIFKRENYLNTAIWYYSAMSSYPKKKFRNACEHILFYAKNEQFFNGINREEKEEKLKFRNIIEIAKKLSESKDNFDSNLNKLGVFSDENGFYSIYQQSKDVKVKDYFMTPFDDVIYSPAVNRNSKERIIGFNGQKPEELIRKIISFVTKKDDIVLDFFSVSGTTGAVAHKMGRQYIGIEQLDYAENDSTVRLKNVIKGDKSGISKSVNWQGGGDFIYCELAKWNETAKEKILVCESLEELIKFFDEMYERYFLNYNLKIKEFREKVIKEEEFKNLTLDEQKKMFIAMLDNNQMYVNKTEMADKKFGIDKKDQKLTSEFYNSEK